MKTIFHYDAGPPLMARLAALAADGFEVMPCPEEDEEYFEALLPDAEVLLHVLKPVTAAVIERAAKLRLIQKIGVGVKTMDLAAADIVSLHLPLVADTARLIDRAALARMKPGAILVNTARGGLVDEPALVEALTSGHLRTAGLDVFAEEPLPVDSPLVGLDNV